MAGNGIVGPGLGRIDLECVVPLNKRVEWRHHHASGPWDIIRKYIPNKILPKPKNSPKIEEADDVEEEKSERGARCVYMHGPESGPEEERVKEHINRA